MENNKKHNKVLFLSIIIFCIVIFIINITKPNRLYHQKNNELSPISFGFGKNKKIICIDSICLILPLVLYVILSLLY